MFVAYRIECVLVGATLGCDEEAGKFGVGGQLSYSVEGGQILAKYRQISEKWMTVPRQGLTKAAEIITLRGSLIGCILRSLRMEMTGAEIAIRCLQEEGVEYLFGYPGGAVLFIYDELYKQDKVKHILVRHEQAAIHAADGYARSTDKVGVALVTSGPGATNAVTGIATAYMDSIPLVIISGQVPTSFIGEDAFQEVDTIGITRPCVKHNFLVKNAKDIATTIKKAFYLAKSGRPGPVLVDIPKDVSAQKVEFSYPTSVNIRSYNPSQHGDIGAIRQAAQLLLNAKRPMIYAGGGVVLSSAASQLTELVRLLGFPVTNTLMGLGGYPATDKQSLGMLGMHGTLEANMAMQNCDVLLAVGARFDDRVIGNVAHFAQNPRKIIHIDIDPSSISKRVKVDVPIVGDVAHVLGDLLAVLHSSRQQPDAQSLAAWWAQIADWRSKNSLIYRNSDEVIKPQFVIETLYDLTGGDAFVTSDVGQHQMWAAQYYKFDQPRRWINSGGLGTMGFGLPAAMGVQLAHPGAQVACVTGEGSIQMNIQELSTCKQFRLPIKIIALNNRYLGMVRQWQEFFHGNRYSESYMDALPDFAKLAEAYGHIGIRVEKPSDVRPALQEAFARKNDLVFLDFQTDPTENVYPMVPGGKGLSEVILAEDL
ncbi:Acetolactate synthase isozyme 3 large subunit [Ferriphaselus amnicola]|uniref:Acetolactate synthase n=2 Tax=Ferriphaselus amnicola TaxID=1188319 RepID=A0A2Z6GDL5_9PROT|nr:Acetolactate synthase isozyme 3 large subunit [Ferriphaselus amnicola]